MAGSGGSLVTSILEPVLASTWKTLRFVSGSAVQKIFPSPSGISDTILTPARCAQCTSEVMERPETRSPGRIPKLRKLCATCQSKCSCEERIQLKSDTADFVILIPVTLTIARNKAKTKRGEIRRVERTSVKNAATQRRRINGATCLGSTCTMA